MYHHPFWKEIFPNIQPETPMAHSWLVISSQKCPLHWQWTTTGLGPITYTDDGNDGKEHICLGHSWNILPTTKYAYYCVWQDQEEFLTNQISSPILTCVCQIILLQDKKKKKMKWLLWYFILFQMQMQQWTLSRWVTSRDRITTCFHIQIHWTL